MVHYAIIRKATAPELCKAIVTPPNDYWKIRTPDFHKRDAIVKHLKGTNYARDSGANRVDLTKAYCRRQRGLLMYDRFDEVTLRAFIEERKIKFPGATLALKGALVMALEAADEKTTFRFLDLPVELQVNILEQHLADVLPPVSPAYYGLSRPPFRLATRQLYVNTINTFIAKTIQPMYIYWPCAGDIDQTAPTYKLDGLPALMSRKHYISSICRLYVWVNGVARTYKHYGHIFILITLPETEDGQSQVEFVKGEASLHNYMVKGYPKYPSKPMPKGLRDKLEGMLRSIMREVRARKRFRTLKESDLKKIYAAVREVFKEWDT